MWAIFGAFFGLLGIGVWVGIALGFTGLMLFYFGTGSIVAVLTFPYRHTSLHPAG